MRTRWRWCPAALLAAALALAGCSVERITDEPEAVSEEQTDDAAPTVDDAIEPADGEGADEAPGQGAGDSGPAQNADEDEGADPDSQAQQAQPIAFGMPDFPGSVTSTTIEELLLEACGTPEICVDYVLVDEHSDKVPEGAIIRTDPPKDARVEHGDTVTIVRSLGPAPSTQGGDGDEQGTPTDPDGNDTETRSENEQGAGGGATSSQHGQGAEGGDDDPDNADNGDNEGDQP